MFTPVMFASVLPEILILALAVLLLSVEPFWKEDQRRNRKTLKKISDAIEDHKGLATFIGLVITASIGIVTLILKFKGY